MPNKPDLPCAICGGMMWRGKGVATDGTAAHKACRREATPKRCGTPEGHRRHRTLRETPCMECRLAWNEACKQSRQKSKDSGWVRTDRPVPQRRRTPKGCSGCGRAVLGTLPNPICSECRGMQPGRHIRITPKARRAIYERDNWTCQICQEPVDPTVSPLTRWGATLDHIEPWSSALIPDDRPSNLRLAHRRCNSVRGASVA